MAKVEAVHLTPRLQAIADQIASGARLADIGTDHAYLPIWLIENGRVASAIASDIREGPLARAEENAARHGCLERISLRLGAGLERVCAEECDTVSIAGMGGETIADILAAAPWTAAGEHLLLLQPMTMTAELRCWLWAHGYEIERESLCREDHRRYVVLTVRGGAPKRNIPLGICCVSPALCKAEGAAGYLEYVLQREARALAGMEQARDLEPERLAAQRMTADTLKRSLEELK